MTTELRHVSFSSDAKTAAKQAAENARDANLALLERIPGYYVEVRGYAAVGATGRITLAHKPRGRQLEPRRPRAVLLVSCQASMDASTPVYVTPASNFGFTLETINVPEPTGLTVDTAYDFIFLVLE